MLGVLSLGIPVYLIGQADDAGEVRFHDSVIHLAAKNGELDKIRAALDAGADINTPDEYGKTVLHHSAENGHSQTTKSLINLGADPSIKDFAGHIALELARNNGHTQTAGVLEKLTLAQQ
jgi:uncharacterized protein